MTRFAVSESCWEKYNVATATRTSLKQQEKHMFRACFPEKDKQYIAGVPFRLPTGRTLLWSSYVCVHQKQKGLQISPLLSSSGVLAWNWVFRILSSICSFPLKIQLMQKSLMVLVRCLGSFLFSHWKHQSQNQGLWLRISNKFNTTGLLCFWMHTHTLDLSNEIRHLAQSAFCEDVLWRWGRHLNFWIGYQNIKSQVHCKQYQTKNHQDE